MPSDPTWAVLRLVRKHTGLPPTELLLWLELGQCSLLEIPYDLVGNGGVGGAFDFNDSALVGSNGAAA